MLGGRRGSTCLELLVKRDELRSHVRLLLGRHGGQRRRRLVQLLLPRPELRQRLLRSAQAALQVGDQRGTRGVGARRGCGARGAADVQHALEHALDLLRVVGHVVAQTRERPRVVGAVFRQRPRRLRGSPPF